MTQVEADIQALLLARHGISDSADADFQIMNQAEIASTLSTVTNTLTLLLGSIAGISLVVGGIGIMNMMLTTVTERTARSDFARRSAPPASDLTSQFLAEAVALTMLGGIVGIALGWAISLAITTLSSFTTTVSVAVGAAGGGRLHRHRRHLRLLPGAPRREARSHRGAALPVGPISRQTLDLGRTTTGGITWTRTHRHSRVCRRAALKDSAADHRRAVSVAGPEAR